MNVQNQIRLAEYQTCGQFLTPDMLTVGMGGQTAGEYRAQFYLWAVLGAPLILSNDIRTMATEDVRLECKSMRALIPLVEFADQYYEMHCRVATSR